MHGWQSNKEMDRGKNMGERHVAQTKIDLWSNLGQEIKKSQREWDMGAGDQLTPGGFKGSQSTKGDCFETWCDIAILTLSHHKLILTNSHTIHEIILSNMFHVNVNCLLNQSNDLFCLFPLFFSFTALNSTLKILPHETSSQITAPFQAHWSSGSWQVSWIFWNYRTTYWIEG